MNRKIKNTLALVALLVFILAAGGSYIFFMQRGSIKEKEAELNQLMANDINSSHLAAQYEELMLRAAVLDSVLAAREFVIPANLSSIKFFDFITQISLGFAEKTQLDVEYVTQGQDKEFFYHEYKVSGGGEYADLYRLIYAIEQSKELKKIKSLTMNNLVTTDKMGYPLFHVSFTMVVHAYYSSSDRFATASLVENNLLAPQVYDAFYPLIRNEIPPNVDQLLDVQEAKLLALIPEGAFLSDSKGNTYLLWEGEPVYLGYMTNIDYKNNRVSFILNKGGVIEKVELNLEKDFNEKVKK